MERITRRELLRAGVGAVAMATIGAGVAEATRTSKGPGKQAVHQRMNFNRDFLFCLGDHPGAEAVAYDDRAWDEIGLPHSFSIPYWGGPQFYIGYGWYRKRFAVDRAWVGKKLYLEFEAAFQDAEIFVNGHRAGGHRGGYTGFRIDITPFVSLDENVLAVRLNNLWDPELAPRAGEHQFSGGLYRSAWLVAADPVHIPYCGTWVTTPTVSEQAATVAIQTDVENGTSVDKRVTVRALILRPDGRQAGNVEATQNVAPGGTARFDLSPPNIHSPQLWHPDHPHLYNAIVTVSVDGIDVDEIETAFGLRWFEFTADRGFFLNGEHYWIHGANVHQDHAGWGDAVTSAGIERDVRMVKDAGFNFIRGSHYPHSRAFYEACDRLGILVWSELCFWGIGGSQNEGFWSASAYPINPSREAAFEDSCRQQLREMITEHRNHPSVIAWSMCNEVFFSHGEVMDKIRALLKNIVALSHELDPHRPAGIGGCQRGDLDHLGDIAGYNGDGARLFLNPGIANLVTEYGSCGDPRPGDYTPCYGDTEGQDFAWRSGIALWCMFDHGSIASIGKLGCVDYFRVPKRRWYWYREQNRQIPPPEWPKPGTPTKLRLEADRTTISGDGLVDCRLLVTVLDAVGAPISNSPPVTLRVISGPGRFPTGPEIPFAAGTDIPIIDGQAAIEFRSYFAGETVIEARSPGLDTATIRIKTVNAPAFDPSRHKPAPVVLAGPTAPPRQPDPSNPNLAFNRPTRASSEQPDHRAMDGNDGDPNTRWCADDDKAGAWWQVDLENVDTIRETVIRFEMPANYRYTIALSLDGTKWTTAVDQTGTESTDQVRRDTFPAGAKGRYLRVTYITLPDGAWASHYELEVYGH